jgi:hypothetical protein
MELSFGLRACRGLFLLLISVLIVLLILLTRNLRSTLSSRPLYVGMNSLNLHKRRATIDRKTLGIRNRMKLMAVQALLLAGLPLLSMQPITVYSADVEVANGQPSSTQNAFAAYPWFPLPDPLTRERPDATLAGPAGSTPPPYTLFADINYDPAWWQRDGAGQDPLHALKFIPLDPKAHLMAAGH